MRGNNGFNILKQYLELQTLDNSAIFFWNKSALENFSVGCNLVYSKNAPITAVDKQPITAEHQAL